MTFHFFVQDPEVTSRRHPLLVVPLFLALAIYFGAPLVMGRLRLPRLAVSAEGIAYEGGRRREFVHWDEVSRLGTNPLGHIQIGYAGGRVAFTISRYVFDVSPSDVLHWLEEAHPYPVLLKKEQHRLSRKV